MSFARSRHLSLCWWYKMLQIPKSWFETEPSEENEGETDCLLVRVTQLNLMYHWEYDVQK